MDHKRDGTTGGSAEMRAVAGACDTYLYAVCYPVAHLRLSVNAEDGSEHVRVAADAARQRHPLIYLWRTWRSTLLLRRAGWPGARKQ